MFLKNQPKENIQEYYNLLKIVGGLSNLFSDNNIPYLYYRAAENIFCKAFEANNLSRGDSSADASKNSMGIGLKTFLNSNGNTLQKIAEFNKDRNDYHDLIKNPEDFIRYISLLRNKRLDSTKVIHSIDNLVYHCVAREADRFLIFEEEMNFINIDQINNIKPKPNSISFNDKIHEYNFNISKSTLFKRFNTNNTVELKVDILKDPYEVLRKIFEEKNLDFIKDHKPEYEFVILPLFSTRSGKVADGSGLNQWNARGRKRDINEVYIPVPAVIHKIYPTFFPPNEKGISFNLHLPNGNVLSASMCQDSFFKINGKDVNKGKGLMSNPNKELGKWILRDILKIPEGTVVTYEMLVEIGIDSVEVRKIDSKNYEIDFKKVNSYYDFVDSLNE
ncbi:MAG: restriction endonuclease [Flavobacterium circumlabens]|uniref:restriction endonuclease n=1 Tax=Flavobacterium circumlabens TaxID=2133765 RepID=UPI0032648B3F